jgi:3-dehydroquinate synthase
MPTISVNIPGAPYDVHVERGLLERIGPHLCAMAPGARVALVTDSHVGPIYAQPLRAACAAAGIDVIDVTIPAGEAHKTLAMVQTVYDQLLDARVDRNTPVVALGGGVIGDVAGFAAATVLRGVPFVQVPTTLLAMVDASIGGKTGVNHARGKNLIGAFHQPRAVFIDPDVLTTLPPRELRNGLAECIKHDLIRDADGFARLERDINRALSLDADYVTDLVAHNVAIKARVVEADPLERGERAHLNFGHTFAHAMEKVLDYAIPHGEAVAVGIVAAATLSRDLGMIDDNSLRRVTSLIHRAELPMHRRGTDANAVLDAMTSDKKATSGRLRFVLLESIGRATVRDDVPLERVAAVVESVFG